MTNPDVVARRLLALNDALTELARPACGDAEALVRDAMLRAAVERWLQVAIEAAIDIAHHVVAARGWTPSPTARSAFTTLAGHGLLEPALATRLARAAALRNVLVHEYIAVDLAQLAHIVAHDLTDLRTFAAAAVTWIAA
jgi:uncharacterized protein YutE (UPF0331/DUF86 family)